MAVFNVLSADAVAGALGIDPVLVVSADFGATVPMAYAVYTQAASDFPTQGSSYLVMSSGTADPEIVLDTSPFNGPSVANGGPSAPPAYDIAQLTLVLSVPEDAQAYSFDFKFFSTEFPDYVGSPYNDAFIVEVGESNFTFDGIELVAPNNIVFDENGQVISINTTGALGMTTPNAFETAWQNRNAATTVLSTSQTLDEGATTLTLIFTIFDVSDDILDSAVFIDNFRFTTTGGGGTQPADNTPPECSGTLVAGVFEGLATDLLSVDPNNRGIAGLSLSGTNLTLQNIDPTIPDEPPFPEAVTFEVVRTDTSLDGIGVVTATDGAGNTCQVTITIPADDGPPVDTTPPECGPIVLEFEGPGGALSAINSYATDPESGIASVLMTSVQNLDVFIEGVGPYTQGDTHTTGEPNPETVTIRGERISFANGGRLVVRVYNGEGLWSYCDPVVAQLSSNAPDGFDLSPAYPNPVVISGQPVQIRFALAEPGPVALRVFDLTGREVMRLVDHSLEAGQYEVTWDGNDTAGRQVAAGVYVYRLDAGPYSKAHTMTVIR